MRKGNDKNNTTYMNIRCAIPISDLTEMIKGMNLSDVAGLAQI